MKDKIKIKSEARPLSRHKELKDDKYFISSKIKLQKSIVHKIKKLYIGALDMLDIEFKLGNMSKELHNKMRSHILNLANDQIRNIQAELNSRYNVEFVPYHIEMKVLNRAEEK